MKTKKYAIVVFTAIAVIVSVMFVAVGSAAINWDYEYAYPEYVLHVTETRLGTWADADEYILHPYLPDDKGRIKTEDGSGGWITHKATLVSGPYKTPREVCPAIEGLPKEKVDIWYPCEELMHPCVDGICDIDKGENCENCPEDCKCRDTRTQIFSCDKLHPEADEMGCYPLVTCPPHSHVEHEECVCDQGYTWNADDTRCVKVKCPPHSTNVAELDSACPQDMILDHHCCCDEGYKLDKTTEKCEESCAAQCKELSRWIDGEDLKKFLLSRGYTAGNCPTTGAPPPGSVKFWDLNKGQLAHTSVVLPGNRQIEMGHEGFGKTIVSAILHQGKDPKPFPEASGKPRTYTPHVSKSTPHGMLCPPPNSLRDMKRIEDMKGIVRYGEDNADNWNCHGFSAYLIYNYVETSIQVRPDTNINWDQALEIGAIHGYKPIDINIPQGQVRIRCEYTIEVRGDQTAVIHIIEGKADYQGVEHSISLSSGQMAVIDPTGVPSAPTTFDVNELDQWWKMTEPSLETSQEKQGLTFESRSKPSGSSVQIPLTLNGIKEKIGNIDTTISYDLSVLEATEVIKGGLTTNSIFDYNILNQGTIKISLADKEGFSGDGSIAYVKFNVIGSEGSSAPLRIAAIAANRAEDDEALEIPTIDGVFRVISMEEGRGDSDGDGEYTALDALCALRMAVEKIPEDLVMDMNRDGSVTSLDAREILRIAVGIESK